ncbi:MAG: YncE family protein, partial [Candidatus Binatota bacterium]
SALVVLDTTKAVTDPMNAVLNRLRLGRSPEVVAADPLGQFVYVGRHGHGELLILDAAGAPALTQVAVLGVGRKPKGIAIRFDGSLIYVSNHESDDVTVISRNGSTHTILDPSVPVERKPLGIGILPEGTKVYVANERSDTVSVIEAGGNTVVGSIPVGDGPRRITVGKVPKE